MKTIILTVIIFSTIVGLAVYSGIVKIAIPGNLFGMADISSDGFQFVGEVELKKDEQFVGLENVKTSSIKQTKAVKKINIISTVSLIASSTLVVTIMSSTFPIISA